MLVINRLAGQRPCRETGKKRRMSARMLPRGMALIVMFVAALAAGAPADASAHPRASAHHRPSAHRHAGWRLDIPGIGVSARLLRLGGPYGEALPVPSLAQAADAGWYRFTATPGARGNAVVVGHVDTYTGPGAFYNLYRLHRGERIYAYLGEHRERFTVRMVEEVPKARFPVNQVFGSTKKHQLWLITCGGSFDYATRHYMDNIIVLATAQVWHHRVRGNAHTRITKCAFRKSYPRERNEQNYCRRDRRLDSGRGGDRHRRGDNARGGGRTPRHHPSRAPRRQARG
jgi:hypothetical protein